MNPSMVKAKKLHIKTHHGRSEALVPLEEAAGWDYSDPLGLVIVEGQLVRSYQELLALASREPYRDRESLEVYFLPALAGG